MTKYAPWKTRCDGEGCGSTMGDIAVFLWYYIKETDKDYCPNCFDKLPQEVRDRWYSNRDKLRAEMIAERNQ